ncbi:MAG: glucose-6-phosphate dehydrogenase [bacterium]|nr:glucose-6-phosphate dehydrogenase [bacterium]
MENKKHLPTILIVLGATGDLMHKKIIPALFNLFDKGKTPKLFHIIGYSRRDWNDDQFKALVMEILHEHHKDQPEKSAQIKKFVNLWSYNKGTFENLEEYKKLAIKLGYLDNEWKVCANKLFYIAAPPQYYESILHNLKSSNLTLPCSPKEGFTRVLIEKPFGKDAKTAANLELLISKSFKEEQIYRIDHYLAKEMLQNILSFRFSNALFESSWSNKYIEKVRIRVWETLGVEKRGAFYDGLGTLRDVGQNHLLQMVALMTMDHPGSLKTEAIRSKRAEILKSLIIPDKKEIRDYTYRSQYKGYRSIKGVDPKSNTETYFKVRAFLNTPRWKGVPFILESGKRIKEAQKEIIITFKHPEPCLCPPTSTHDIKNRVIFQFEPEEGVFVDLLSKKPGLHFEVKGSKFQYYYREGKKRTQYVEEYEKLLLDAIDGDQTLFVRSDEVVEMWQFVDPIVSEWQKNIVPLKTYKPDTEEPMLDSQFIDVSADTQPSLPEIKKEIGVIGLGKMGANISRRLVEKNWKVIGHNRTSSVTKELEKEGIVGSESMKELISKLSKPRILWLSLPAGKIIDEILFGKEGIMNLLNKNDVIIDGGNSFYKDSIIRAQKFQKKGIKFIDAGVSGGPSGARNGASIMIGGQEKDFKQLEQLFFDLSLPNGYQFFKGNGAGHFVKMVHTGIEYGMMQAIAEGFAVLKKSEYKLDLTRITDVYNHGSVIESKLINWLKEAFVIYGENLIPICGSVKHTGEGEWTIKTAKELGVKTKIIESALQFRIDSEKKPDYTGKVVSALRGQFGRHKVSH